MRCFCCLCNFKKFIVIPDTFTSKDKGIIVRKFCKCLFLPYSEDAGDQARVTTPARAKEIGSDYIVVGRPITQSADPAAAYAQCVRDFVD